MLKGGNDGFYLYSDAPLPWISATLTPQIYPEGISCRSAVFEPGGGGINVARAITHLGGKATAIFPQAVPPEVNTWSLCWPMNRWPLKPLRPKTGRGKTCMST